jgi:adenylate kinase
MAKPLKPNVLITGTPGTGKSALSAMVEQELGLKHLEIGKIVKENNFFSEFDTELDTHVIEENDEDRLLDHLEPLMVEGGKVVDYHSCELFPERWFAHVIVLRTSTETLFERLTARGYSDRKREENMEAEICAVVEDEALNSYAVSVVHVRDSNTLDEMAATVDFIRSLLEQ